MRRVFAVFAAAILLLVFAAGQAFASISDSGDVNGLRTFHDDSSGRYWLDMDNFFSMCSTGMISKASAAGFTFASKRDVEGLLFSLPLTGGKWGEYELIMGGAPCRGLIWGSYRSDDENVDRLGWAWAAYDDESIENRWYFQDSQVNIDEIPNLGTMYSDMNIWAYRREGGAITPEPVSMLLFSLGGLTMAALRRRRKV